MEAVVTTYAMRSDRGPTPQRRAAGCPATGWVHEGHPPWRVIVADDPAELSTSIGDVLEYTGDEHTVTVREWMNRGPDRYLVFSFDADADFRADQREEARFAGRREAEAAAVAIVRAGRPTAIVQRVHDGRVVAFYDQEEVDGADGDGGGGGGQRAGDGELP